MPKIIEILGAMDYGTYCVVQVMLDNQEVAEVFVGGDVECFWDTKYNKFKAIIKRRKDLESEG